MRNIRYIYNNLILLIKSNYKIILISLFLYLILLAYLFIFVPTKGYFNDVARYFYSSLAQTMGALIAIILSSIYIFISNFRYQSKNPVNEPIKRLVLRDPIFINSLLFGFICILLSLLFIIPTSFETLEYSRYLLIFSLFINIVLGTISIYLLIIFITVKLNKYSNASTLLNYLKDDYYKNLYRYSNYLELYLLSNISTKKEIDRYFLITDIPLSNKILNVISENTATNIISDISNSSINEENFTEICIPITNTLLNFSSRSLLVFHNQTILLKILSHLYRTNTPFCDIIHSDIFKELIKPVVKNNINITTLYDICFILLVIKELSYKILNDQLNNIEQSFEIIKIELKDEHGLFSRIDALITYAKNNLIV